MSSVNESEQIAANREAMRRAADQMRISGLYASPYALELFEQRIRNELTDDEVRAKLKAYHTKTSSTLPK
jgi:cyclopropane fatty-acyl-phospholipid synthase-like methyltransferase